MGLSRALPVFSTSLVYGAKSSYISYLYDETSLNELRYSQYQWHVKAMWLPWERERERCILYDLDTSWSTASDWKTAVFSLSALAVLWLTFGCMGSWAVVLKSVTIDHAMFEVGEACQCVRVIIASVCHPLVTCILTSYQLNIYACAKEVYKWKGFICKTES